MRTPGTISLEGMYMDIMTSNFMVHPVPLLLTLFNVGKVVLSFGIFRSEVIDEDKFPEFFIFIDLRMS